VTDHTPASAEPSRSGPPLPGRRRWGALLALQFLTIVPLPGQEASTSADHSSGASAFDMSPSLPWFPLVGGLIGVTLAGLDWALRPVLALPVRDAALLAAAALITGMLHLDGFIDCCDALLGARSVERRLEILKDSRIGAYGAIGITLLLITRFAALGELGGSGLLRVLALVAAPLLGRWGIVYAVTRFPYARPQGLGSLFQRRSINLIAATGMALVLLALIAGVATLVRGSGGLAGTALLLALFAAVAFLVTVSGCFWASRRLDGGLTGDTYGAVNELVEVVVLALAPVLSELALHVARHY
jgi:adenosylcobinamide-GDP ribazoletransferase